MSSARLTRLRHPAPWVADLIIVLVLAGPVIGVALGPGGDGLSTVGLSLAALLSIFARRHYPQTALAVATLAGAVNPDAAPGLVPALVILYTIASRRPWPAPAPRALAVVAASAAGELVSAHPEHVANALGGAVECAAAVALGLYVGARRAFIDALRDRADRADRERVLLAERAVAEERLRIAQDLHDVVAHNVSLMVVQAQALGVTVEDPRVRSATDAVADLGRQAMTEMHRTLRLLRADDDAAAAERAPQPSLANLDKLIEQSRASGMEVELTVEGEPRRLAQTVELSAFRIVQEALTNVIKHAGRAHTRVTVGYRPDGLELRITDSGGGRLPGPVPDDGGAERRPPGGGHGVIGMRERAALFGGTLTAGPGLERGFEVRAVLPYADGAGAAGAPGAS
jgi:signal transduction histidine kinase